MRRYGYAAGALVGVLLTGLALLFVSVRTGEAPRVVNSWPLLAALGACVATWWLQGLIVAVLARPRLERLRLLDTFRVYMAGTFVAGISPVRRRRSLSRCTCSGVLASRRARGAPWSAS